MIEYRYERKFVTKQNKKDIEMIIKLNKTIFRESYKERIIHNVYLDTINKKSYIENDLGLSEREKIRIRWYDKELTKPRLEIKKKKENLTGKETHKIKEVNNIRNIKKELLNNKLPDSIKNKIKLLEPAIINSYIRKYYISQDKKYRITIDDNITYYDPKTLKIIGKDKNTIIELKYKPADDKNAKNIQLPYRLEKNSKYANGLLLK